MGRVPDKRSETRYRVIHARQTRRAVALRFIIGCQMFLQLSSLYFGAGIVLGSSMLDLQFFTISIFYVCVYSQEHRRHFGTCFVGARLHAFDWNCNCDWVRLTHSSIQVLSAIVMRVGARISRRTVPTI